MIAANKASIPGNNELDAVSLWAAWLQGKVAMIYSWPPTGRMSAELFAERQGDQLHPAVDDRRQGRLCGGAGQSGACDRLQQGARGRFGQSRRRPISSCSGRCSPPVSLARVHAALCAARSLSPVALQVGALRRALARRAKDYLVNLNNSANVGAARHDHAGLAGLLRSRSTACAPRSGPAPIRRRRWRRRRRNGMQTTERLGVDCQKAFYAGVQEAARLLRRPYGREARAWR